MPSLSLGIAFNIAFVKIPIQMSMAWSKENEKTPVINLTAGVAVAF
jgi:hypothetical protein